MIRFGAQEPGMYTKVNLEDVDEYDPDDVGANVKPVGYELQPEKMRPSVWLFDEGDENRRHRQTDQEELYYVVKGNATMEVDGDEVEMDEGDFVVVSPEHWRQITAHERTRILVVGAPNVKDDHVTEEDAE
ncbi:MAG: cupin domain-containing protein [Halobacteria archaeon]|nr:cupin domain-containing protein [Halobacteria archaeon]